MEIENTQIKENKPDIIAFQEVRIDSSGLRDQIKDLQNIMHEYKWKKSEPAHDVTKHKLSVTEGWEKEGIGILSRKRIVSSHVIPLPYTYGPDSNRRIALRVKVQVNKKTMVEVVVVHFSYDRKQQCKNAKALHMTNVIILGDFNTYNDYEWPIRLMTSPKDDIQTQGCFQQQQQLGKFRSVYIDAWEKTKKEEEKGLTFSNMPTPGLESRPDRILVNAIGYNPLSSRIVGDGATYRAKFNHSIMYYRTKILLYNSYLSYKNTIGYSCEHDCGPHGSCRCGICVKGGNQNGCLLPECSECNRKTFQNVLCYLFVFSFTIIHLFYGILSVLLTGSNYKRDAVFSILGCNCCLCNRKLFTPQNFNPRKYKFLKWCRLWPLFRLPPYLLLAISMLSLIIIYLVLKNLVFSESLKTINSVMDEEFYISDHLMLIAELEIKR
ncbi:hypothetical protein KUTeg_020488 [Tegillarca granosa]|uniref:Endonuclease/exonuclease/phosphatase domain-containing protein n=1 Tax=Tegillarca granosa TaxID=220873 RepID=A0ABQ9EAS8_TEGGR|nr:hypothetical protein KUTeg_020488 [Tegillarca granosa]